MGTHQEGLIEKNRLLYVSSAFNNVAIPADSHKYELNLNVSLNISITCKSCKKRSLAIFEKTVHLLVYESNSGTLNAAHLKTVCSRYLLITHPFN